MSYFSQTQRKQIFNPSKIKTPSPFQYNNKQISKPVFAKVPFGSTTKLNRSISSRQFNHKNQPFQIQQNQSSSFYDLKSYVPKKEEKTSAFKSQTQRFYKKQQFFPGPAEYTLNSQKKKIKINENRMLKMKSMSQSNFKDKRLKVPSIPSDHLGYKQGKANLMEKVVQTINLWPQPGQYELRTQIIKKNGVDWKKTKQHKQRIYSNAPGPGYYQMKPQQNKAVLSSFKSTNQRFKQVNDKKIKSPGPGYYNLTGNINDKNLSEDKKLQQNQFHFNSKTSRFNWMNPSTNIGPGQYLDLQKNKSKSMIQFKKLNNQQNINNVKQKKTIFDQSNLNPGPGQYANTLGMGFQLQKQLLRKYTDSIFPKQKRKLFQQKKQKVIPGPGTYNLDQNQKNNQTKKKKGLYKKSQVINLKNSQDEHVPSPFDYANFNGTIQQKLKQVKNKLTLTDFKPFGLGQERFKHYLKQHKDFSQTKQTQNQFSNKKTKKIVMTNIKVNIPFGSSTQKFNQINQENATVSDFYLPEEKWIKKSYNIKSKLSLSKK